MKRLLLAATLSSALMAGVHPAKITSIKKIGEDSTSRTFELTYVRRATEKSLGTTVTLLPTPFVTEHARHLVTVVLFGEAGTQEKQITEKARIKIKRGDVADETPVLLQPPVSYSCRVFSGIPRPPEHCQKGATKDLCNAVAGCKWLPADYAGPYPPALPPSPES